jgi:hypothetical protein
MRDTDIIGPDSLSNLTSRFTVTLASRAPFKLAHKKGGATRILLLPLYIEISEAYCDSFIYGSLHYPVNTIVNPLR